jgi:polyphosphate kinase
LLLASYFEWEILPVLTPIALDSAHPAPQCWLVRDGLRSFAITAVFG